MNILLIHLSDMHFQTKDDDIFKRIPCIKNAVRDQIIETDYVWIVLSGDITYSGKQSQYETALDFFSLLQQELKSIKNSISLHYVTVPGNHDCNFDLHTETRDLLIDSIVNKADIASRITVVYDCLSPLKDYFNWSALMQASEFKTESEKLYLERVFDLPEGKRIKFCCYNSAWMSRPEKEGTSGNIVFPTQLIPTPNQSNSSDLVFSVLHHPYNWFQSGLSREFRTAVEATSNIIITGHEHASEYYETRYLQGETKQYVLGKQLQGPSECGFNTILIDLAERKMKYTEHDWNNGIFAAKGSDWIVIPMSTVLKQDKFVVSKSFLQYLMEPGMPLSHPRKKTNLALGDIYVFPDLEEVSEKNYVTIIHSDEVSDYLLANKRVLLFGPSPNGKTSLLKMMFPKYHQKGFVPLWVKGEIINSANPEKLKVLFSNCYGDVYGKQYLGACPSNGWLAAG